jgi:catechol 2,3-dioxygenase-like lactoylglutathione lyase family enzyme
MYKFTSTRLLVVDYRACFRFYRDIMGFEVVWGNEEGTYADFEAGETDLALFQREEMAKAVGTANLPRERRSQDDVCVVFFVDSVDQVTEDLKQKGVQFVTEPKDYQDWGIRAAHFRDPDGNLIEINQGLSAE